MSPTALGVVSSARVAPAVGGPWSPLSVPGCQLWLDADQITGLADGADMAAWLDLSGNGRDFVKPSGSGGVYFDSTPPAGIVRNAAVDMVYMSRLNSAAAFMSGKSSGEIFVVYRGQDTGDNTMWNNWGSDPNASHWPFTDGVVYDDWGSTVRKSAVGTGLAPLVWHAISIHSAANDWGINSSAGPLYTTTSNTVGWASVEHTLVGGPTHFAEIFIYDRKVSASERAAALAYLEAKWFPPTTPVPGIADCSLWLDPTDASSLTLSGSSVTGWVDRSVRHRTLTAVGSVPPTSGVRTINGKNALDCTTGVLRSQLGAVNDPTTGAWTAFAVVAPDVLGSTYNVVDGDNGATRVAQYIRINDISVGSIGFSVAGGVAHDTGPIISLGSPAVLRSVHTGTSVESFADGATNGATAVADQKYLKDNVLTVGGYSDGATGYFDGALGEVIAYSRALTAGEIAQVDSYLREKWGTP